ncbi:MAG: peptidoglycan-binding protein [Candidatus Omnitrophota bacterium]
MEEASRTEGIDEATQGAAQELIRSIKEKQKRLIEGYLEQVKDPLKKKEFAEALRFAMKALEVKGIDQETRTKIEALIERIEKAERAHEAELERLSREAGIPQSKRNLKEALKYAGERSPAALAMIQKVIDHVVKGENIGYGFKDRDAVIQLQTALKLLGHMETEPDGIFGGGTKTAVMKFQGANYLTERIDIVGPDATARLIEALIKKLEEQAPAVKESGEVQPGEVSEAVADGEAAPADGEAAPQEEEAPGIDEQAAVAEIEGYLGEKRFEEAARAAALLVSAVKDPKMQKKAYKLGEKAIKKMQKEGAKLVKKTKEEAKEGKKTEQELKQIEQKILLGYTSYEFALKEAYRLSRDRSYTGNAKEWVSAILARPASYDGAIRAKIFEKIINQETLTEEDMVRLIMTRSKLLSERFAVDWAIINYLKVKQMQGVWGSLRVWVGLGIDLTAWKDGSGLELVLPGVHTKLFKRDKDLVLEVARTHIGNQHAEYYKAAEEDVRSFLAYRQEAYQLTQEIAGLKRKSADFKTGDGEWHSVRHLIDMYEGRLPKVEEKIRSLMGLEPGKELPIDLSKPFSLDTSIGSAYKVCAEHGIQLGVSVDIARSAAAAAWGRAREAERNRKGKWYWKWVPMEMGIGLSSNLLDVRNSPFGFWGITGSVDMRWTGRSGITEAYAEFLKAVKEMHAETAVAEEKLKREALRDLKRCAEELLITIDGYIASLEETKNKDEEKRELVAEHDYYGVVFDIQRARGMRDEIESRLQDVSRELELEHKAYTEQPEAAEEVDSDSVVESVLERLKGEEGRSDIAEWTLIKKRAEKELERVGSGFTKRKGILRKIWGFFGWIKSRIPVGLADGINLDYSRINKKPTSGEGWQEGISEQQTGVKAFRIIFGIKLKPAHAFGLHQKSLDLQRQEAVMNVARIQAEQAIDIVRKISLYRALKAQLESAERKVVPVTGKLAEVRKDQDATTRDIRRVEDELAKAEMLAAEKRVQLVNVRAQISLALGANFSGIETEGPMTMEEVEKRLKEALSRVGAEGYNSVDMREKLLRTVRDKTMRLWGISLLREGRIPVGYYGERYTALTSAGEKREGEKIEQVYAEWTGLLGDLFKYGLNAKRAKEALDKSNFDLKGWPQKAENARMHAMDGYMEAQVAAELSGLELDAQTKILKDLEERYKGGDYRVLPVDIYNLRIRVEDKFSEVIANRQTAAEAYIQFRRISGKFLSEMQLDALIKREVLETLKRRLSENDPYIDSHMIEEQKRRIEAVGKAASEAAAGKKAKEPAASEEAPAEQKKDRKGEDSALVRQWQYQKTQSKINSAESYIEALTAMVNADVSIWREVPTIDDKIDELQRGIDENNGYWDKEKGTMVVDPNAGTVTWGRPGELARYQENDASLRDKRARLEEIKNRQIAGMLDWKVDIRVNPLAFFGESAKAWKQAKGEDAARRQAEYAFVLNMAGNYFEAEDLKQLNANAEKRLEGLLKFREGLFCQMTSIADPSIKDRIQEFTDDIVKTRREITEYRKRLRYLESAGLERLKDLVGSKALDLSYLDTGKPVDFSVVSQDFYRKVIKTAMEKYPGIRRHVIAAEVSQIDLNQFSIPRNLLTNWDISGSFGSREMFDRVIIGFYLNIIEPGKAYRKAAEKISLWINQEKAAAAKDDFRGAIFALERSITEHAEAMLRAQAAHEIAAKKLEQAIKDWKNLDPNAQEVLYRMRRVGETEEQFINARRQYNQDVLELEVYLQVLAKDRDKVLAAAMTEFSPEERARLIPAPEADTEVAVPELVLKVGKAPFGYKDVGAETKDFLEAVYGSGNYNIKTISHWGRFFVYLSKLRNYDLDAAKRHIRGMTEMARKFMPQLKNVNIPDSFGLCVTPYSSRGKEKLHPLIGLLDYAIAYEENVIARGQESLDQSKKPQDARKRVERRMEDIIKALKEKGALYLQGVVADINRVGLPATSEQRRLKLVMMKPYGDILIRMITADPERSLKTTPYAFKDRRILETLSDYIDLHSLTTEEADRYYKNVLPGLVKLAKDLLGDSLQGENLRRLSGDQSDALNLLYAQKDKASSEEERALLQGFITSYEQMMQETLTLHKALALLTVAMENARDFETTVEAEVKKVEYVAEVVQALTRANDMPYRGPDKGGVAFSAEVDLYLTVLSTLKNERNNNNSINKSIKKRIEQGVGLQEIKVLINVLIKGQDRTVEEGVGRIIASGRAYYTPEKRYVYTKEGNLLEVYHVVPYMNDHNKDEAARRFTQAHRGIIYIRYDGTTYDGGDHWREIRYKDGTYELIIKGDYAPGAINRSTGQAVSYTKVVSDSPISSENQVILSSGGSQTNKALSLFRKHQKSKAKEDKMIIEEWGQLPPRCLGTETEIKEGMEGLRDALRDAVATSESILTDPEDASNAPFSNKDFHNTPIVVGGEIVNNETKSRWLDDPVNPKIAFVRINGSRLVWIYSLKINDNGDIALRDAIEIRTGEELVPPPRNMNPWDKRAKTNPNAGRHLAYLYYKGEYHYTVWAGDRDILPRWRGRMFRAHESTNYRSDARMDPDVALTKEGQLIEDIEENKGALIEKYKYESDDRKARQIEQINYEKGRITSITRYTYAGETRDLASREETVIDKEGKSYTERWEYEAPRGFYVKAFEEMRYPRVARVISEGQVIKEYRYEDDGVWIISYKKNKNYGKEGTIKKFLDWIRGVTVITTEAYFVPLKSEKEESGNLISILDSSRPLKMHEGRGISFDTLPARQPILEFSLDRDEQKMGSEEFQKQAWEIIDLTEGIFTTSQKAKRDKALAEYLGMIARDDYTPFTGKYKESKVSVSKHLENRVNGEKTNLVKEFWKMLRKGKIDHEKMVRWSRFIAARLGAFKDVSYREFVVERLFARKHYDNYNYVVKGLLTKAGAIDLDYVYRMMRPPFERTELHMEQFTPSADKKKLTYNVPNIDMTQGEFVFFVRSRNEGKTTIRITARDANGHIATMPAEIEGDPDLDNLKEKDQAEKWHRVDFSPASRDYRRSIIRSKVFDSTQVVELEISFGKDEKQRREEKLTADKFDFKWVCVESLSWVGENAKKPAEDAEIEPLHLGLPIAPIKFSRELKTDEKKDTREKIVRGELYYNLAIRGDAPRDLSGKKFILKKWRHPLKQAGASVIFSFVDLDGGMHSAEFVTDDEGYVRDAILPCYSTTGFDSTQVVGITPDFEMKAEPWSWWAPYAAYFLMAAIPYLLALIGWGIRRYRYHRHRAQSKSLLRDKAIKEANESLDKAEKSDKAREALDRLEKEEATRGDIYKAEKKLRELEIKEAKEAVREATETEDAQKALAQLKDKGASEDDIKEAKDKIETLRENEKRRMGSVEAIENAKMALDQLRNTNAAEEKIKEAEEQVKRLEYIRQAKIDIGMARTSDKARKALEGLKNTERRAKSVIKEGEQRVRELAIKEANADLEAATTAEEAKKAKEKLEDNKADEKDVQAATQKFKQLDAIEKERRDLDKALSHVGAAAALDRFKKVIKKRAIGEAKKELNIAKSSAEAQKVFDKLCAQKASEEDIKAAVDKFYRLRASETPVWRQMVRADGSLRAPFIGKKLDSLGQWALHKWLNLTKKDVSDEATEEELWKWEQRVRYLAIEEARTDRENLDRDSLANDEDKQGAELKIRRLVIENAKAGLDWLKRTKASKDEIQLAGKNFYRLKVSEKPVWEYPIVPDRDPAMWEYPFVVGSDTAKLLIGAIVAHFWRLMVYRWRISFYKTDAIEKARRSLNAAATSVAAEEDLAIFEGYSASEEDIDAAKLRIDQLRKSEAEEYRKEAEKAYEAAKKETNPQSKDGKLKKAHRLTKKALEIDPDNKQAQTVLAGINASMKTTTPGEGAVKAEVTPKKQAKELINKIKISIDSIKKWNASLDIDFRDRGRKIEDKTIFLPRMRKEEIWDFFDPNKIPRFNLTMTFMSISFLLVAVAAFNFIGWSSTILLVPYVYLITIKLLNNYNFLNRHRVLGCAVTLSLVTGMHQILSILCGFDVHAVATGLSFAVISFFAISPFIKYLVRLFDINTFVTNQKKELETAKIKLRLIRGDDDLLTEIESVTLDSGMTVDDYIEALREKRVTSVILSHLDVTVYTKASDLKEALMELVRSNITVMETIGELWRIRRATEKKDGETHIDEEFEELQDEKIYETPKFKVILDRAIKQIDSLLMRSRTKVEARRIVNVIGRPVAVAIATSVLVTVSVVMFGGILGLEPLYQYTMAVIVATISLWGASQYARNKFTQEWALFEPAVDMEHISQEKDVILFTYEGETLKVWDIWRFLADVRAAVRRTGDEAQPITTASIQNQLVQGKLNGEIIQRDRRIGGSFFDSKALKGINKYAGLTMARLVLWIGVVFGTISKWVGVFVLWGVAQFASLVNRSEFIWSDMYQYQFGEVGILKALLSRIIDGSFGYHALQALGVVVGAGVVFACLKKIYSLSRSNVQRYARGSGKYIILRATKAIAAVIGLFSIPAAMAFIGKKGWGWLYGDVYTKRALLENIFPAVVQILAYVVIGSAAIFCGKYIYYYIGDKARGYIKEKKVTTEFLIWNGAKTLFAGVTLFAAPLLSGNTLVDIFGAGTGIALGLIVGGVFAHSVFSLIIGYLSRNLFKGILVDQMLLGEKPPRPPHPPKMEEGETPDQYHERVNKKQDEYVKKVETYYGKDGKPGEVAKATDRFRNTYLNRFTAEEMVLVARVNQTVHDSEKAGTKVTRSNIEAVLDERIGLRGRMKYQKMFGRGALPSGSVYGIRDNATAKEVMDAIEKTYRILTKEELLGRMSGQGFKDLVEQFNLDKDLKIWDVLDNPNLVDLTADQIREFLDQYANEKRIVEMFDFMPKVENWVVVVKGLEGQVRDLVEKLCTQRYPFKRMKIIIAGEEWDYETIELIERLQGELGELQRGNAAPGAEYCEISPAPPREDGQPYTKPGANTFCLKPETTDGAYGLIFDAEDIPDKLMVLKKVTGVVEGVGETRRLSRTKFEEALNDQMISSGAAPSQAASVEEKVAYYTRCVKGASARYTAGLDDKDWDSVHRFNFKRGRVLKRHLKVFTKYNLKTLLELIHEDKALASPAVLWLKIKHLNGVLKNKKDKKTESGRPWEVKYDPLEKGEEWNVKNYQKKQLERLIELYIVISNIPEYGDFATDFIKGEMIEGEFIKRVIQGEFERINMPKNGQGRLSQDRNALAHVPWVTGAFFKGEYSSWYNPGWSGFHAVQDTFKPLGGTTGWFCTEPIEEVIWEEVEETIEKEKAESIKKDEKNKEGYFKEKERQIAYIKKEYDRKNKLTSLGGWDEMQVAEDYELGLVLWWNGFNVPNFYALTSEDPGAATSLTFEKRALQTSRWNKGFIIGLLQIVGGGRMFELYERKGLICGLSFIITTLASAVFPLLFRIGRAITLFWWYIYIPVQVLTSAILKTTLGPGSIWFLQASHIQWIADTTQYVIGAVVPQALNFSPVGWGMFVGPAISIGMITIHMYFTVASILKEGTNDKLGYRTALDMFKEFVEKLEKRIVLAEVMDVYIDYKKAYKNLKEAYKEGEPPEKIEDKGRLVAELLERFINDLDNRMDPLILNKEAKDSIKKDARAGNFNHIEVKGGYLAEALFVANMTRYLKNSPEEREAIKSSMERAISEVKMAKEHVDKGNISNWAKIKDARSKDGKWTYLSLVDPVKWIAIAGFLIGSGVAVLAATSIINGVIITLAVGLFYTGVVLELGNLWISRAADDETRGIRAMKFRLAMINLFIPFYHMLYLYGNRIAWNEIGSRIGYWWLTPRAAEIEEEMKKRQEVEIQQIPITNKEAREMDDEIRKKYLERGPGEKPEFDLFGKKKAEISTTYDEDLRLAKTTEPKQRWQAIVPNFGFLAGLFYFFAWGFRGDSYIYTLGVNLEKAITRSPIISESLQFLQAYSSHALWVMVVAVVATIAIKFIMWYREIGLKEKDVPYSTDMETGERRFAPTAQTKKQPISWAGSAIASALFALSAGYFVGLSGQYAIVQAASLGFVAAVYSAQALDLRYGVLAKMKDIFSKIAPRRAGPELIEPFRSALPAEGEDLAYVKDGELHVNKEEMARRPAFVQQFYYFHEWFHLKGIKSEAFVYAAVGMAVISTPVLVPLVMLGGVFAQLAIAALNVDIAGIRARGVVSPIVLANLFLCVACKKDTTVQEPSKVVSSAVAKTSMEISIDSFKVQADELFLDLRFGVLPGMTVDDGVDLTGCALRFEFKNGKTGELQIFFKDNKWANVYSYPTLTENGVIGFDPATDNRNINQFEDFSHIYAVGAKVFGEPPKMLRTKLKSVRLIGVKKDAKTEAARSETTAPPAGTREEASRAVSVPVSAAVSGDVMNVTVDQSYWTAQTYYSDQAIYETRGELELPFKLKGGSKTQSKGEAFIDLRYADLEGLGRGPHDMSGIEIKIVVKVPAGLVSSPFNGLQIFAKSGDKWQSQYSKWRNIDTAGEIELTFTPTRPDQDPQGWSDPGFDPTDVVAIGLKLGSGGGSTLAHEGVLKVKSVTLRRIGTQNAPKLVSTPYLRSQATTGAPVPISEFQELSGVSLYYSPSTYGRDIGGNNGFSNREKEITARFKSFKEKGINLVRIFTFCDLRNGAIKFDSTGKPVGYSKEALEDLKALIRAAKKADIKLIPVLFDFTLADGISEEGGYPVGEYPSLLTNQEHREALLDVFKDFLKELRTYMERNNLDSTVLAFEPMNEPEMASLKGPYTLAYAQGFVTDFVNLLRRVFPNKPVSLSTQKREYLKYWIHLLKKGDVMQIHWYSIMKGQNDLDHSRGELNIPSGVRAIYGEAEPTDVEKVLSTIHKNGFGGALFWHDKNHRFLDSPKKIENYKNWFDKRILPGKSGRRGFTLVESLILQGAVIAGIIVVTGLIKSLGALALAPVGIGAALGGAVALAVGEYKGKGREDEDLDSARGEAVGIVIGIAGASQDEIDKKVDMRKIGGVKVVALDGTSQEENLQKLEKARREYGAYASGLIEGVTENLESVLDNLITSIQEEDRARIINEFTEDPEKMFLDAKNVDQIKDTLDGILNRLDVIRSKRAAELSIYEYKFDKVAKVNRIVSQDTQLADKLARIREEGKTKVASFRVQNAAELRWLAQEHRKAIDKYGQDKYPVRLHIRMADENITRDNLDKVLELAGVNDVISKDDISFEDGQSVSEIYELVNQKYGAQAADVAIGDTRDLMRDKKDEDLLKEENMLYVRMEEGIVSQLYSVVIELITNNNQMPKIMPENTDLRMDPRGYFVFKPIKPINMEELRREIENYEKVLIMA